MTPITTPTTQRGTQSMNRAMFSILTIALFLGCMSIPLRAQDAFTTVDQILRYMQSPNYTDEDLMKRLAWNDKLVNDLVTYRPDAASLKNYYTLLNKAITHYQDENSRLRVLLRAVTTIDPLIARYFPQWIVQDEAMILEIMRKVRDNRDDVGDADALEIADRALTGKAHIRVYQSPNNPDDLIAIVIEKARTKDENNTESPGYSTNAENPDYEDYRIVGRNNLKRVLTDDLYAGVANRGGYAHLIETGVLKPAPHIAEANISIPYGGGFLWTLEADERPDLGPGIRVSRVRAGFEMKLGNDWVNLPFLYGPEWNALIVYEPSSTEYIKVGPAIPFSWGDESLNNSFPVLKPRRLNGTWGMSGEYFKQLSNISGSPGTDADGIGAAAFVSFGLRTFGTRKITNAEGEIINGDNIKDRYRNIDQVPGDWDVPGDRPAIQRYLNDVTFYYLTSTATAYYWRDLGFLLDGLRIAGGIGYQKVNEARRMYYKVDSPSQEVYDSVLVLAGHGKLDPYLRLSYDHRGITTYGAALQYFNGGLMADAYINLFSWMQAEVKYSRVVFRDPEAWEWKELIVPGIRLSFAF